MPTTPTARNYDITHIQQGPGDIWVLPGGIADSSAPQVILASDGSPDSTTYTGASAAINVGTFGGATTITAKPKADDISVDQADGPVASYVVGLAMSIETALAQLDPKILQYCAPMATFATQASPGYNQLTFGGMGIISPICIAFISGKRGAPGKFIVAVLFNGISESGLSFAIGRAKPSENKVTWKGLVDLTRAAGRQTGVIYETL